MEGPKSEDSDESIAQINIIPLVDVVLVLLIIFMVTTVFTKDSALPLNLPKGSRATEASQPPAEIIVNVEKSGDIYVNNQKTQLSEIAGKIQLSVNRTRETILVIRGDKDVVYGKMMPVLDEVSQTGVKITLALTPNTEAAK